MKLRYLLCDVFTDRPFGGNPLAVFPAAEGISDETMRAIARELNLSETVFVFRGSAPGRVRVRIFTPSMELPYAGHPTVGTACMLAQEGLLGMDRRGMTRVTLEELVGPIAVDVRLDGDAWSASFAVRSALEVQHDVPSPTEIAELLSLDVADLEGDAVAASLGVAFLLVGVRDVDALSRARLSAPVWDRLLAHAWAPHVYVWTRAGAALRARMFAPAMGIAEDPATGAAASALAGWLARDAEEGSHAWVIEQGNEMGRPSVIEAAAVVSDHALAGVRIGGRVVRIGSGELVLPG